MNAVIGTLLACSRSSRCVARARSPLTWNVSATSGRPVEAWLTNVGVLADAVGALDALARPSLDGADGVVSDVERAPEPEQAAAATTAAPARNVRRGRPSWSSGTDAPYAHARRHECRLGPRWNVWSAAREG